MRSRVQRHVFDLFDSGLPAEHATARPSGAPKQHELFPKKPDGLTWHDYLLMLLHIGSEIEHGLMVQYLYAAYSLGGEQVPSDHREKVQRWRDSLLTIAKEEMGHLLSIQNLICLLGGPINLYREDYPFDSPYYPFPFRLEPLTLDSLSCYVYAEMEPHMPKTSGPKDPGRRFTEFEMKDRARIRKAVIARVAGGKPHHAGEIYERIIEILSNADLITDSDFNSASYASQASWDEWGKGYRPNPDDTDAKQVAPAKQSNVIVAQMATRTEAVAALKAVAGQGEAPHLQDRPTTEPSHFDRFVGLYQGFERIKGWKPNREAPINPTTVDPAKVKTGGTYIEAKASRAWADLFNVRYRMLLTYLAHTYRARPTDSGRPNVRGLALHRVFAEMYNIKAIADILFRLPLRDNPKDPRRAGPPFQMPYTLALPTDEADCWQLHRDLIRTSQTLCDGLLAGAPSLPDGQRYLATLRDLDRQAMSWIDHIRGDLGSNTRQRL